MVPELVGVEFSRETHPSLEEMFFPAEYPWELRDHVTSSFDLDLFRGSMHANGKKKPGRETEKGLLRGKKKRARRMVRYPLRIDVDCEEKQFSELCFFRPRGKDKLSKNNLNLKTFL